MMLTSKTLYFVGTLLVFTVAFSSQETCPAKLVTNFHQKNCTDNANETHSYYLDRSHCIPKCARYPTSGTGSYTRCNTGSPVCAISGFVCENRCGTKSSLNEYTCNTDKDCQSLPGGGRSSCLKYCVPATISNDTASNEVTCMAYHSDFFKPYTNEKKFWTAKNFKPVCDDDGNWEAKQCKGGLQGRCYCYTPTGKRLFGEALYADSANMTCACSRRKFELEQANRNYVSFHCDSMGNYEKLQCDVEKGLCWCAEPQTGAPTSPFVPQKIMTKLQCYSSDTVGKQYLRQCESKKFAYAMIAAKLKAHGIKTIDEDELVCDGDGAYGPYMIDNGSGACTWRDNSKIDNFRADLSALTAPMTCNCARDKKRYQHNLKCEGTGEYAVIQSAASRMYYCVDDMGFSKSDLFVNKNQDCSKYY